MFVDQDKRGTEAMAEVERILAELRASGDSPERAGNYGDPFMLQAYYPQKDRQRIASLFGQGFADSVFELDPGGWRGPVLSGYGLHAVFLHERAEFPIPPLEEIRDRVTQEWVDDKRREITDQYFADLLARYQIVVEGRSEASDRGGESAGAP